MQHMASGSIASKHQGVFPVIILQQRMVTLTLTASAAVCGRIGALVTATAACVPAEWVRWKHIVLMLHAILLIFIIFPYYCFGIAADEEQEATPIQSVPAAAQRRTEGGDLCSFISFLFMGSDYA